jgi:iron complex transport system substrate-binding protein
MYHRPRSTLRTALAAFAGISLIAAACGSDDQSANDEPAPDITDPDTSDSEPDADPSDPDTTVGAGDDSGTDDPSDADDGDLRIVSLSPTATEALFAIGAGDQLVAIDENSNFPEATSELPNELSAFEPSVEAIAAFEPDLVLIGGDFTGLGDQLSQLEIEFLDLPPATSIDDAYAQIEQLGAATGQVADAGELVVEMQSDIDAIVSRSDLVGETVSFYHEISSDLFSADSTTFIGELYSLLGLSNIADADTSESFGFPQLNAEFVVEQNPDLIFVPTGTFAFTTAAEVAARPGWDAIAAVQNGNVIETDDEIAGRWGPRIVDYLEQVLTAVDEAGFLVTSEAG